MDRKANVVKISVLPNLISGLSRILVKVPAICFVYIDMLILKFI